MSTECELSNGIPGAYTPWGRKFWQLFGAPTSVKLAIATGLGGGGGGGGGESEGDPLP